MNETILIIEDEEEIRSNLKELLELIDYKILTAENGKLGINTAIKNSPDLIICDILMPDINGYEVYEELQKCIKTHLIPFIYLTAKADISDIRKGMQLGADDYIIKPFSSQDIIKSVRKRIDKAKQRDKIISDNKAESYNYEESILISTDGQPHLINFKDIVYISADNQYTFLYITDQSKLRVRKSIKHWEKILPDNYFLRIHRATIVNKNYIEKIEKWFNNSLIVKIKNYEIPLPISQRFASKLRKKLGE